jgi:two-component system response regulator HydG
MQAAVEKRAAGKVQAGVQPSTASAKIAPKTGVSQTTFLASSPIMKQLYDTVERVAMTDATILILGENGTGKSDLAHLIHQKSNRLDKPFVIVDLGSNTRKFV